jgi:D-glycero-D-manno-heptose 1,7-bisphosphate phosphatase
VTDSRTPKAAFTTVFLDRDGVINRDSTDYIKRWEEFSFLPRSIDAIALLADHGLGIMIITNQSIIGRGWVPSSGLEDIHRRMVTAIEAKGGRIDAIYYCPHHPDAGCDCRKPEPGLILNARTDHGLDLARAVMVGDSAKDIECARRAGCGAAVLVKTGNYDTAIEILAGLDITPDFVAHDLRDAAAWILKRSASGDNP